MEQQSQARDFPLIELQHVTKAYSNGANTIVAIRDCDLTLGRGEFTSLTGVSGSGKSTLLNLLGLLLAPTSGTIRVSGETVIGFDESARSQLRGHTIGFIFQSFNLIPWLTISENVALGASYAGLAQSDADTVAIKALQDVGLGHRLAALPAELSGGQQQRVAIARAIATRCEILLCDEPTGNLDTTTTREVLEILRDCNERGISIVLATHDLDLASRAERHITVADGVVSG